ncbi:MAG: triose-phosphate isomerase [Spirochaetae bacterium HGW-Spirochaetae-1]|jgi:triosephosphate isomerase|nr:MAG: triose-phosphate isomerase [Spirochaetae bacterium HGW-Spirochaetae-1]
MGRREIFAGNWKMYKTYLEAEKLVKELISGLGSTGKKEVIIFPPAPFARHCADMCKGTAIDVGMQNMYFEDEGAFTGEVSPAMVKDAGCRYILIGHSERRHVFGETDGDVNKKVKAAFKHGLEPVICVGELLEEREKSITDAVLKRQIEGALKDITAAQMEKVVIAYEPVWAIGTGKVATPEIAEEAHAKIRDLLKDIYGTKIADSVSILYGGSVKPDNIKGLFSRENIDGVLVGGASLKSDSFLDIVHV